ILRITGRIDSMTSLQLEDALNNLIAGGSSRLILNLSQVDFISSSGLRVFLSTLKNVKVQKGDLKICGTTPGVEKIFKIAGFVSLFDINQNEPSAIQKFE